MKQIRTDGLGFDEIKANLKTYLRGQSEFDSYDFEGSAMSVILDVLAYNTHYNLLYTNLAVNESFIDSASKKSSVVSLAKSLGYTAKSMRGSRAIVTVTVAPGVNNAAQTLVISKGTLFKTSVDSVNYDFAATSDSSASRTNGIFVFNNVELVEGSQNFTNFTVTETSQYVIPNGNVDTTTIEVIVSAPNGTTSARFYLSDDMLRAGPADRLFFIKQRDDLLFEIYFGNDVIGKSPELGHIVNIKHITTSGPKSNGANIFTLQTDALLDDNIDITTVQPARNGAESESIESVRFNAPRSYVTQNRAVTAVDYENILREYYPDIETIAAWGGQDNIPQAYGKIFIALKPYGRELFDNNEKSSMLNSLLLRRGVVTITPEFVDPEYLNIELSCNVYYNENKSRFTGGQLRTAVRNALVEFNGTLSKFDSVFRFSKVSALIDSVDSSIVSNAMSFRVRVPTKPIYNSNARYTLTHKNPIEQIAGGSFYTTRFYTSDTANRCYIKDDGLGVLQLYKESGSGSPTYIRDVGTIDYSGGAWDVVSLTILELHDPILEFVFVSASNDVVSNRHMLVKLRPDLIEVTAISDKIASGVGIGGNSFTFTRK